MSEKVKYPLHEAATIAKEVLSKLEPFCSKACIAGSIRRMKSYVGDAELLVIPKWAEVLNEGEMFKSQVNLLEREIQSLIACQYFELRKKINGTVTDGHAVKLLRHIKSGIPVDIFFTTPENWISALVCRTGGKTNNEEIARRAKTIGYRWKMSGAGFYDPESEIMYRMKSEEELFQFVGLPYLQPEERN